jgi:hypothetical protein
MATKPVHVLTEPPNTSTPTNFMQLGPILADCSQKNIATTDSTKTNSTSNQRIIEDSIKIFAQLENKWKRQRAPQRLRQKLLETRTSKATVTARIFHRGHGQGPDWADIILGQVAAIVSAGGVTLDRPHHL